MDVKLKDIVIGDRFREVYKGIDELADSISKYGLIEPIIIDENNNLIAGERRYKAHQVLKRETIECKYIKDLNELEKKEVELEENIMRQQFTWQEEVCAKDQLHKLKQKIHGKAVKGKEVDGVWKLKDTAEALGQNVGTISLDLSLAKGIKAFPELQKEKSKSIALKKLKKKKEDILQKEFEKRLKAKGITSHPEVSNRDCLEVMTKMKSSSVDLILTDPPYGINIEKAHTYDKMTIKSTNFEDGEFETFNMLDKVFKEMYRILRDDRHIYVFCGIQLFPNVVNLLIKHGFSTSERPLIWDKGSGSYPSQQTTYVHSYEAFVFAQKGRRKLNGSPKDLFTIKRVPSGKKIHPTEKPTELLRGLIEYSTFVGEHVFDPFAGSGATLVAARETNRMSSGVELNITYYEGIVKRLNGGN